jgi:hypothetical protein
MNALPNTPETLALAKRLIWFEAPAQALLDPIRLLAYAFQFGRAADFELLNRHYSTADLQLALQSAPPGIIDARSYAYWCLMLDLPPLVRTERLLRDFPSQLGSASAIKPEPGALRAPPTNAMTSPSLFYLSAVPS